MDKVFKKLKERLNKDKKTSNLILIIILLVILLISMNYIFSSDLNDIKDNSNNEIENELTSSDVSNNYHTDLEKRLSNILTQIEGITEASVLLTYSTTEKVFPIYDTKEDVSVEEENSKTSTKTTKEQKVAYEDTQNGKEAIVESKELAKASGAIIALKGEISSDTMLKIKEAVSAITEIPIHKIQIFSK